MSNQTYEGFYLTAGGVAAVGGSYDAAAVSEDYDLAPARGMATAMALAVPAWSFILWLAIILL